MIKQMQIIFILYNIQIYNFIIIMKYLEHFSVNLSS